MNLKIFLSYFTRCNFKGTKADTAATKQALSGNPKSQYLNPKQIQMTENQNSKQNQPSLFFCVSISYTCMHKNFLFFIAVPYD